MNNCFVYCLISTSDNYFFNNSAHLNSSLSRIAFRISRQFKCNFLTNFGFSSNRGIIREN